MDHQVIANEIKTVTIEANALGAIQPFAKFDIKYQVPQALALDDISERLRQPDAEKVSRSKRRAAVVNQDSGIGHV
jgi:hypothetical protein